MNELNLNTAGTEKPDSVTQDSHVPKGKQTSLGLYVTCAQAYEKWKTALGLIKVIDVRIPEEYALIGHPEMAWNVPLAFVPYQRKDGKFEYIVEMNSNFMADVKAITGPKDTLLIMCRSGSRSAIAVNQLAEAGFKNVYNIIDGMEGDKVDDPGSVFFGKRMRNGWKNSGLPWVYGIDPEKMIIEESTSKQTQ